LLYNTVRIVEQNLPETLQNVFIINGELSLLFLRKLINIFLNTYFHVSAPWVAHIAINFVKCVITGSTLSKIVIFNEKKDEWMPLLRNMIPEDIFPDMIYE